LVSGRDGLPSKETPVLVYWLAIFAKEMDFYPANAMAVKS
jgi:hypothetical protein